MKRVKILNKQLLWVLVGTISATVALGLGLSIAVNYSLKQFERQPDVVLPGSESGPTNQP